MDGVPDECPFAEICVPVQAATIQGAINGAGAGTVITVKDGTYLEHIDFLGKAITVASENGPATTTIDAGGVGPTTVAFKSGEGPTAVLEGFTITGGVIDGSGGGGGIAIINSSPTIRGNVVTGNGSADTYGGGILVFQDASPVIEGNSIVNNTSRGGGGIFAQVNNNVVRVADNVISTNTADGELGGGVYFENGTLEFIGNEVADNTGASDGGGLMIQLSGHSPCVVASNVFRNNDAVDLGGGMYLSTSQPIVVNNLVVGNSAKIGAGVRLGGTGVFANNTVVDNTASEQGGGIIDDDGFTIVSSIVRGNTAPASPQIADTFLTDMTYSNVEGGFPGTGNIDADPLFADPGAGDYRLMTGSPSVDAGSNAALPADAGDLDDDGDVLEPTPLDLDDEPRQTDDPDTPDTGEGDAPIVDMGAYERPDPCPFDLTGDGQIGFDDLVQLLSDWGDPYGFVDLIDLLANWGPCPA